MVSITLSVPQEQKAQMDRFSDMNWSGFVRGCIEEKLKEMVWKEELLQRLKSEQAFSDWAVEKLQLSRKGRFAELKKKGLV